MRNLLSVRYYGGTSYSLRPLFRAGQGGNLVAALIGQQEEALSDGYMPVTKIPLRLIQFKDRKSSVIRVVFTAKAVNRYLPVCPIGTEIDVVVVVFLHIESPFKVAFTQLYVINVVMFM